MEVHPLEESELRLQRYQRPVEQHPAAVEVAVQRLLADDGLRSEPGQRGHHRRDRGDEERAGDDRRGGLAGHARERQAADRRKQRVVEDDREQERHDQPQRLPQQHQQQRRAQDRRHPDQRPGRQEPVRAGSRPARRLHSGLRSAECGALAQLPAELAGELQRDLRRDHRVGVEQALEVAARKRGQHAVVGRPRLQGTGRIVEQRELAEDDAGVELGDPPGLGLTLPADQHATADDDVDGLALLALVEDDLALHVAALVQQAVDDSQLEARQRGEQRQLPQRAEARRFLPVREEPQHRQPPTRRPRTRGDPVHFTLQQEDPASAATRFGVGAARACRGGSACGGHLGRTAVSVDNCRTRRRRPQENGVDPPSRGRRAEERRRVRGAGRASVATNRRASRASPWRSERCC